MTEAPDLHKEYTLQIDSNIKLYRDMLFLLHEIVNGPLEFSN